VQLGRNLVMDLEDANSRARFLIRDQDSKFTAASDALLADAGLKVVTTGIRIPRMNSLMERWIQTCQHELLDRTLIWNQSHLLHALSEFESFYNWHRTTPNPEASCAASPTTRTDQHASARQAPGRPSTRPTRRDPARVPTCRLSRPDD
jgi:hypothetical protein